MLTFYTDDNVDGPAIRIARELGVDIVTSDEADLLGAEDLVHFRYALDHDYVLVTGNFKHFEPLFIEFLATGEDHPGMVFIRARHHKNSVLIAQTLALTSKKVVHRI